MLPIPSNLVIGGALALTVAAFAAGWQVRSWRCDAALRDYEQAVQAEMDKRQQRYDAVSAQYETERTDGQQQHTTRVDRINTIYKDRIIPADCAVPDDVRRLLVEAVTSANTSTVGKSGSTLPTTAPATVPAD